MLAYPGCPGKRPLNGCLLSHGIPRVSFVKLSGNRRPVRVTYFTYQLYVSPWQACSQCLCFTGEARLSSSPVCVLHPFVPEENFCGIFMCLKSFFSPSQQCQSILVLFGSRSSDHYFRSVSVCLSVCVCRVFLSRLWSDFDQTRTQWCCPVSERLAKQLSKKKFRFIRINWKAPMGKFLLS